MEYTCAGGVMVMSEWQDALGVKRGFLYDSFQVFHLKDKRDTEFEFHSHVFHKLILFLNGSVKYNVEGKTYALEPWDILLISDNEIHRPMIDSDKEYDRVIIWVHDATLRQLSLQDQFLGTCFSTVKARKNNRIRGADILAPEIKPLLKQLLDACKDQGFGSAVLKQALFIQLMVLVNRIVMKPPLEGLQERENQDPRIPVLLDYINAHLGEDLSIQSLSEKIFFSRFYLMHQFKAQTGFTLHQYILKKRLYLANSLVKQGHSLTSASQEAGFSEYSSFLRAFQKQFGMSPRAFHKQGGHDNLICSAE